MSEEESKIEARCRKLHEDWGQLLKRGQFLEKNVFATEYARLAIEATKDLQALCREEFDYQAAALVVAHGAASFCRHEAEQANWALMIDDWHLVAVGPDDVRSQYGYFCEAEAMLDETAAEAQVMRWLKSGDAYEDYRTKTHCRYCM